jgi:hypothetical protein
VRIRHRPMIDLSAYGRSRVPYLWRITPSIGIQLPDTIDNTEELTLSETDGELQTFTSR